jgi:small subunit ribosomal protein S2
MDEDGSINSFSKKMGATLRREKRKITRNLGGIREMGGIPGAMVVVDPAREYNAVREAKKLGILVIGILDTDCDPMDMDIVIPGNDDALKSARLMVDQLVIAVEEGCANHREALASAEVAEHHEDDEFHEGDPRPTRTLRPIPEMVKGAEGEEAAPAEEGTATAVAEAAAPEAAAPEAAAPEAAAPEAAAPEAAAPEAAAPEAAAPEAAAPEAAAPEAAAPADEGPAEL